MCEVDGGGQNTHNTSIFFRKPNNLKLLPLNYHLSYSINFVGTYFGALKSCLQHPY